MNEIANRPSAEIATRPRRADNPLRALPVEWRKQVGFFCLFHSDLLKGQDGVVARLRYWIKDDALTLDEAVLVMKRLMRPDVCAKLTYAGQLLAELAVQVEAVVKDRRHREKEQRFKAECQASRENAERDRDKVREMLANFCATNTEAVT